MSLCNCDFTERAPPGLFELDLVQFMPLKKSTTSNTDLSTYVVDVTPDGQLVVAGSVYQDSSVQNRIVRLCNVL